MKRIPTQKQHELVKGLQRMSVVNFEQGLVVNFEPAMSSCIRPIDVRIRDKEDLIKLLLMIMMTIGVCSFCRGHQVLLVNLERLGNRENK